MAEKTVQDESKRSLGERITEDLRKKRENEAFALGKILPLLKGWKACDATEVLHFIIKEIQNNAVIGGD